MKSQSSTVSLQRRTRGCSTLYNDRGIRQLLTHPVLLSHCLSLTHFCPWHFMYLTSGQSHTGILTVFQMWPDIYLSVIYFPIRRMGTLGLIFGSFNSCTLNLFSESDHISLQCCCFPTNRLFKLGMVNQSLVATFKYTKWRNDDWIEIIIIVIIPASLWKKTKLPCNWELENLKAAVQFVMHVSPHMLSIGRKMVQRIQALLWVHVSPCSWMASKWMEGVGSI